MERLAQVIAQAQRSVKQESEVF